MNSKNTIIKIVFLIIFLLTLFLTSNVYAVVNPTSNFYVNDYADLLSSETEDYIMSINRNLNYQTKAQVVVVTVENLEGNSLEEYATELFRSFGIGDETLNNGVLILIALEERQSRIEVGYGLEGALNDAKTGRIQDDYMIPYLRENNWDDGIKNGFTAIVNEIEKEYNVSVGAENLPAVEDKESNILIIFIAFTLILTTIVRRITYYKTNRLTLRIIYIICFSVIVFILYPTVVIFIPVVLFNAAELFLGLMIGRRGSFGGGSSGGGFSGGGGSSGGGRKLKKFLIQYKKIGIDNIKSIPIFFIVLLPAQEFQYYHCKFH